MNLKYKPREIASTNFVKYYSMQVPGKTNSLFTNPHPPTLKWLQMYGH